MGSYSPIEPDPTPGTGSYSMPKQWIHDKGIQSSMFSSKVKQIDLFNGDGFFEARARVAPLPHPFGLRERGVASPFVSPGQQTTRSSPSARRCPDQVATPRDADWTAKGRARAGVIDKAARQTNDWLILGTQGDRGVQPVAEPEDDWGSFKGMNDVIKKLGEKLELKKTTLAVKLLLKLEGVLVCEATLEKLFNKVQVGPRHRPRRQNRAGRNPHSRGHRAHTYTRTVQAQIAARKYRLQMAYGDMYLKQEVRAVWRAYRGVSARPVGPLCWPVSAITTSRSARPRRAAAVSGDAEPSRDENWAR